MSLRLIDPTKPFSEPMMISELADEPTFEVGGELAVIMKSTKLKVAPAECDKELLVPVMVRT